jgi:N-acetylglutamate synthase-like GNAT family acetyltransferase
MAERGRLFFVVVYEYADRILGMAGLDMNEIRILCVSPGTRRSGIGRELLKYVLTMVPGALFPDAFVYASLEGKEFYKACGFIEKGPVVFDIEGEPMPAVFMTFPLR